MHTSRLDQILAILATHDVPRYRINQVYQAIYKSGIAHYSDITTLPLNIRLELVQKLGPDILSLVLRHHISGSQVAKYLFQTSDNHNIETVRMIYKPNQQRAKDHVAICVSSQSGCGLKCKFCATGAMGFKKNLTEDEICDQLLFFSQHNIKFDSVVFMGMGEALANPNLFAALKTLTTKDLFGLSQRSLSISTVGLIPGIIRLGKEFPQINLTYSLHSPFPNQRQDLMPITKAYPIESVMATLRQHINLTNRKVFIAYILLDGITDSPDHAQELAKLLVNQGPKRYLFHVNLITYNPIRSDSTTKFTQSQSTAVKTFTSILTTHNIKWTIRKSFGTEIDAACGQLAGTHTLKPNNHLK